VSDLLKKGFFIGLGAAMSSKEKFDKVMDDMIAKGQISPGEAKDMMNQFKEKGEKKNQEWSSQSEQYFKDMIQDLGFVTKEEYEKLESRIEKLEAKHENES